jgi:hypothetical protein
MHFLDRLGFGSADMLPFLSGTRSGVLSVFHKSERGRSPGEIEALRITAGLIGAGLGYR